MLNKDELYQWIEQQVEDFGEEDYWLAEVDFNPSSNKLTIFVDCDTGITLEACRSLSRHIEKLLDDEGLLGETYALEVSSPGVDRPLASMRQYQKNLGRIIKIILKDGIELVGKLKRIEEEHLIIQEETRKGKKKNPVLGKDITINFENIDKTFVEVRFK